METFDEWYDSQPLVLLDRKAEHRLTWEAAIATQQERIAELKTLHENEAFNTKYYKQHYESLGEEFNKQAAEIERLKAVIGKCKNTLEATEELFTCSGYISRRLTYKDLQEALAAIKEIEK